MKEIHDLVLIQGVAPLAGELLEEDRVEPARGRVRDPGFQKLLHDAGPNATRWARVPAHHLYFNGRGLRGTAGAMACCAVAA